MFLFGLICHHIFIIQIEKVLFCKFHIIKYLRRKVLLFLLYNI